jgi:predicted membrane-bound spermidine synthase
MQRKILMTSVFIAGMTSLGVEMSASRLLGNVFGTSNIVWANIIGLILIYLTAGYFIGGKWADRSPHEHVFFRILVWAAFFIAIVPLVARPVLLQAASAVEQLNAAVMAGSFIGVLVLFSVPITLLGCISPFAIRLAIEEKEQAGKISGQIYAISTLGSFLGTFIPVLVLVPMIGTNNSFIFFSLLLMTIGLIGLGMASKKMALTYLWMPIVVILAAIFLMRGPIKQIPGQIHESESSYNYIQVVERDGMRLLMLNEGQGIHSVYRPGLGATYGTWDYFLSAPYFNSGPAEEIQVERLGLVGLAAGTISKQYTNVFGNLPIDGWEIDPDIIKIGQEYFDMNEPNLNAIAQDGRWGLAHSEYTYSVIGVDAYRLPYIPFHFTTQEFFLEVRYHLSEEGVLVINVGRTLSDRRLIEALVGTLQSVYPSVHVVDVPATFNTIVYATVQPTRIDTLLANYGELLEAGADPLLLDVLVRTINNLQPTPQSDIVFTDDKAPIEQLTDSIALRFVLGGDMDILR